MVNKLSVAALLTGMATFLVPAVFAKEFQTFEQYQDHERELERIEEEARTLDNSKLRRQEGTFWNPTKAEGFNVDVALNNTIPRCVVAVYYDALDYRNGQKNDAGGKKDPNTWIKPLGVAPVCGDKVGPSKTYPGPGMDGVAKGADSMLFSNYKENADLDTYLILRYVEWSV